MDVARTARQREALALIDAGRIEEAELDAARMGGETPRHGHRPPHARAEPLGTPRSAVIIVIPPARPYKAPCQSRTALRG